MNYVICCPCQWSLCLWCHALVSNRLQLTSLCLDVSFKDTQEDTGLRDTSEKQMTSSLLCLSSENRAARHLSTWVVSQLRHDVLPEPGEKATWCNWPLDMGGKKKLSAVLRPVNFTRESWSCHVTWCNWPLDSGGGKSVVARCVRNTAHHLEITDINFSVAYVRVAMPVCYVLIIATGHMMLCGKSQDLPLRYYNLDLSVRPSVRLFHISSAVCGPIATKLGRNVRDGTPQELRALVSMATKPLSWYSAKTVLWL